MFHEEEDLPLCGAIGSILQTCRHNSILRDYRNNPTEMDRRNTVDALLGHVCESDKNLVVQYSNEQELKLPQAKVGCYNVTNTIVDGVMFVEVTAFKPYLANYEMRVAATALGPKTPKHLRVVHCVTGFKRSNGANQAIMGVVSGIYQKRILGVPGQFTFGVFQYQKSFLEIFAGIWRSDESKIKLYKVGSYSLDDPIQVVQFYLAIREIKQIASVYLAQLRESEKNLAKQVLTNPPAVKWDLFRMANLLEDHAESRDQTQHAGGFSSQEISRRLVLDSLPALEKSYARKRVLSYLESISDPSVFMPVDVPRTPPIDSPHPR
ncbi:unnamed protein product [Rhizoctonia solani]|uniref:Uncharacterized protein n=1 Tax=Rhizoctonia solani TaxID=456999 RepID=A0A8H3DWT2_9AGAM|nr:unnamed protein product [Rhizoctonia solani]